MNSALIIGLVLYVFVGVALVTIGSFGKSLRMEVERMRGKSLPALLLLDQSEPAPSAPIAKIVAFVSVMSVVAIAIWPILLISEFKSKKLGLFRGRKFRFMGKTFMPRGTGLMFTSIGGAGKIVCSDCGYSAKIVCFLHGTENCTTGYQCQFCGQFVQVNDSQSDVVGKLCQCGGTLSRQEELFCPRCRSRNVDYLMEYIT